MDYEEDRIDLINWADILIAPKTATTHFLYVGETGSAKTTLLKDMALQVLEFVGKGKDQRAVIYDPKRDMVSFLHTVVPENAVKIFNPFDVRGVAWKMWKDITEPAHAQTIADIFVPANENANQPFFRNAAHDLLQGVLEAFILKSFERRKQGKPPLKWTLKEVCAALSDEESMKIILSAYPEYKLDRYIKWYLDRKGKDGYNDVMSEIGTHLNPLFSVAAAWDGKDEDAISLTEWRDDKDGSVLVLGSDDEREAAINSINRILVERLVGVILNGREVNAETDTRRTWFILDEFADLEIKKLVKLLKKGRSKGVCVALAFQNYSDVKKVYGEEDADVICSECTSKIFLRCNSSTAKMSAELIGKALCWEEDYSYGAAHMQGGGSAYSHGDGTQNSNTSGPNGGSSTAGSSISEQWTTSSNWSDTDSFTRNRKRVDRDVVRKEAFESLPLPGPENGVSGYAISSQVEGMVWQFHIDWSEFDGATAFDPNEDDFEDREKIEPGYQFLKWSKEDLVRLGVINEPEEKIIEGQASQSELEEPKEGINHIGTKKSGSQLIDDFGKMLGG